jgi:NTE family protein
MKGMLLAPWEIGVRATVNTLNRLSRSARAFYRELTRPVVENPIITNDMQKRPTIGLALGGGFARGLAHVGILKVLEEEQIPIDFIAGTSVGAMIGAIYCSGVSAKEMEEIAALVRFRDFARWTLSRYGFATNDRMTVLLNKLLKVKTFEELRIPLAVTATDFLTGEGAVFNSGPLIDPVRASCAYPGMFLPVNINGRLLVDGLLAHAVPTAPAREAGCDRVIGVYLRSNLMEGLTGPRHVFDVVGQCFSIAQTRMSAIWQKDADIVVEPDVTGFPYDCFDRCKELVKIGEEAARKAMPQIRQWFPAAQPQPNVPTAQVQPAIS